MTLHLMAFEVNTVNGSGEDHSCVVQLTTDDPELAAHQEMLATQVKGMIKNICRYSNVDPLSIRRVDTQPAEIATGHMPL